jgi:predicted RNA-binding Zn-ribbon protein involved in translation (DUF1610 family)
MYELLSETEKTERLCDLLGDVLGPTRNHYPAKSQIAFDCPQCSYDKGLQYDGKGNLEVNYRLGKFNCWACGEETGMHGNISRLFKKWADKDHIRLFKELALQFSYDEYEYEDKEFIPVVDFALPSEFYPLTNAPDVDLLRNYKNYLTLRGITPAIIEKFNIGCAFSGKYAGRIVLPSYNEEGTLNYYVTRAIRKVKKFKYLNCDVPKETIIFNEKFIDWEKTVFIVEGPFDHIVLPNSIPLLGKKLSDLLFNTIYNNAESNIVLVLDPDAWERTKLIYNQLDGGRLMGRVYIVKMPTFVNEKGKEEGIDVSKFNELYGQKPLFDYIIKNTIKIID